MRREPAGERLLNVSEHAGIENEDAMEILIESERDQRTYDWLLSQVGETALQAACLALAGDRRLYVSNLAKVLGLRPPADLAIAPREVAIMHLERMRKLLSTKDG